jgi:hypothetical protein
LTFAETTNIDPSIIAAPESIVTMRLWCPGQSTKLTDLRNLVSLLQFGHILLVE